MQKITAVAFIYDAGKLLVAQRSLDIAFMPGVNELPGGHIELSESMEAGLAREIKEELNIDINVHSPYHAFIYMDSTNTKQTIEIVYFCTLTKPKYELKIDRNEIAAVQWVPESELEKVLQDNPEELLAAKKGFNIIRDPRSFVEFS